MKAFRGTLAALLIFLIAFGGWWALRPPELTPKERKALRDLGVAEVSKVDMKIEDGKVVAYRARV